MNPAESGYSAYVQQANIGLTRFKCLDSVLKQEGKGIKQYTTLTADLIRSDWW